MLSLRQESGRYDWTGFRVIIEIVSSIIPSSKSRSISSSISNMATSIANAACNNFDGGSIIVCFSVLDFLSVMKKQILYRY